MKREIRREVKGKKERLVHKKVEDGMKGVGDGQRDGARREATMGDKGKED